MRQVGSLSFQKPTVFIVHNNEDVNTLLSGTFWLKGFQPYKFTDGKECLKRVREIDGNVDALVISQETALDNDLMLIVNMNPRCPGCSGFIQQLLGCVSEKSTLHARRLERRQHPRVPERHAPQPHAGRVEDRVGDRRQHRLAHRLAGAVVRQVGRFGFGSPFTITTSIRSGVSACVSVGCETQSTLVTFSRVEPHFFVQRAAERVQHAALDRAAQRLGIDRPGRSRARRRAASPRRGRCGG